MSSDIEGKRCFIVGASSGIGAAVAARFGALGAELVIHCNGNREGADAVADAIRSQGGRISVLQGDIADGEMAAGLVDEALGLLGGLDILINNAGFGRIEPFLEMKAATWQKTLAVNVTAVAMMTIAAGEIMKRQGEGRIVNLTSPASRMALPNYAAYAASKAGVDSITRAAAIALAPFGVRVNSVAPGMMDTEMQRSTELDLARIEGRSDVEAFLDERTRRVPLGRRAQIDEVAAGVLWLALDAPPYVTAERLNLSGGLDRD